MLTSRVTYYIQIQFKNHTIWKEKEKKISTALYIAKCVPFVMIIARKLHLFEDRLKNISYILYTLVLKPFPSLCDRGSSPL